MGTHQLILLMEEIRPESVIIILTVGGHAGCVPGGCGERKMLFSEG